MTPISPQRGPTRHLVDNSAVQPVSEAVDQSYSDESSDDKFLEFKRKKLHQLNPEDQEIIESSDDSSIEPAHFDFLRNRHLQSVASGLNDQLTCEEQVNTKKAAKQASCESVDSDDSSLPPMPQFNPTVNYYELYWEMYLRNESLLAQISGESSDRDSLLKQILIIEEFYNDTENIERSSKERYISGRKKHHRRCANEIKRQLMCPYPNCKKFYGSEGSLNLHIKIKHNGGNKTDREKIAKSIVIAKVNGIQIVDEIKMNFNLPPGCLEKAAQSLNVQIDRTSLKKLERNVQKNNEETEKQRKNEILKRKDKLLFNNLQRPLTADKSEEASLDSN